MNRNRKVGKRTVSRIVAVQGLYEYYFNNKEGNLEDIVKDIIEFYIKDECEGEYKLEDVLDSDFAIKLAISTNKNLEKIDSLILGKLKKGNTVEGILDILREIMRVGVFEIMDHKDTPAKIIVNEYVNLVNYFGERKQTKFANAVLDRISKEVRK